MTKLKYRSKSVLNYPISQFIFCCVVMAWMFLFFSYWHQTPLFSVSKIFVLKRAFRLHHPFLWRKFFQVRTFWGTNTTVRLAVEYKINIYPSSVLGPKHCIVIWHVFVCLVFKYELSIILCAHSRNLKHRSLLNNKEPIFTNNSYDNCMNYIQCPQKSGRTRI